jgi:hypothetical protein
VEVVLEVWLDDVWLKRSKTRVLGDGFGEMYKALDLDVPVRCAIRAVLGNT